MSSINVTNIKHPSSGSNNVVLAADGSTTIETLNSTTIVGTTVRGGITSGTAQSATGTAVDFTGIPSWVKRITVMFDGVSTNGTSNPLIQLGTSTGFTTTGYTAASIETANKATYTTGFGLNAAAAANAIYEHILITNISGNNWMAIHTGLLTQSGVYYTLTGSGSVSLSATLDRVRITTVNGTDTFDAGTINIMYEG